MKMNNPMKGCSFRLRESAAHYGMVLASLCGEVKDEEWGDDDAVQLFWDTLAWYVHDRGYTPLLLRMPPERFVHAWAEVASVLMNGD